ncbi:hypothetical protein ETAA8_52910 [Anatilimnocola aggregata]|uniref:DUF7919 domain-containing protein n=1 Tax=Anatilimnocola aggregata TaxID=2528021 RepID=A0A517YIX4_9BACT|nr:hypothetical protein [Anatilimnocola aggregata]QDU30172.1 hypothetical protein ETAA8_52910 [Anatilimnocola aggregata]
MWSRVATVEKLQQALRLIDSYSLVCHEIRRCITLAELRDLTPCTYLPVVADHILAVGWLEKAFEIPTGPTPQEVFAKLTEFARNPWQPFVSAGYHECGICQFGGEKRGTANLFIPYEGKIYVCPELITHYINAHYYSPPVEFCEAVLACPPMQSMAYKRLLVACSGAVLWQTE